MTLHVFYLRQNTTTATKNNMHYWCRERALSLWSWICRKQCLTSSECYKLSFHWLALWSLRDRGVGKQLKMTHKLNWLVFAPSAQWHHIWSLHRSLEVGSSQVPTKLLHHSKIISCCSSSWYLLRLLLSRSPVQSLYVSEIVLQAGFRETVFPSWATNHSEYSQSA